MSAEMCLVDYEILLVCMIREPLKKVKEVLVVLSVLLEKMEGMWGMFCKASECNVGTCLMHPSSCFNRALFIFLDFVLLVVFLFNVISKVPKLPDHPRCRVISWWRRLSSILNGFIGLVYLFIGIWQWLESEIGENHDVSYPYWWLVVSFHGVTWFIVSLTVSLHGHRFTRAPLRLLSILVFLFSVVNCSLSLFTTIVHKRAYSIKLSVDIFSFLGASLLLLGVYKGFEYEDSHESDLYSPLRDDANESVNEVTPFGKAGFINKMSFWWLNPLMKRGRDAILQEKDVPGLRKDDLAESCYQEFIDLMDKQPSIFWAIVQCHYKEILISGLFAMLKIITLSCGPLVLNAFINVATVRKESFEYEGFVLAVVLFFAKFIESLSQRQWYFRSRLIGLKVKSLLTAAIYKKQLRLSNAAKLKHSTGEIMNYVTVDAYRIGEFPFWLHQTWTLLLQVSLAIVILFRAVGLATIASLVTILLTVLCNTPLAKLQHKFQCKLMEAQDKRLKAISEALSNMKVLKLYAWESHFKNVTEKMRLVEEKCLSTVQSQKAYNCFLFWASPVLVSAATFGACFFLDVPLYTSNVFTFLATLRLVQDPLRTFPDVISVVIQAKTSFSRLVLFLEATELESEGPRKEANIVSTSNHDILIKSADLSWENDSLKPTLRNINLEVAPGQKIAICGEVGSGKSTLLASLLGELPILKGIVQVSGTVAYVSQSAWIQTGSIRDNIIFGSSLDTQKYQDTLEKCSLLDDIELMPYGDLTEIGERGVNLSGGQKQRIQLARSLYREADIYLLDDPFSAVDAHTASDLFNNYVMGALSRKTVLLVTHQVEFLPAFDFVLLMADGNILHSGTYHELLSSSKEFQDLVNAHKNTSGSDRFTKVNAHPRHEVSTADIQKSIEKSFDASGGDHLIKKEEREVGDTGFKPYVQYLNKKNGFLLFSLASLAHLMYVICQILQLSWMAEKVDTNISTLRLIMVYLVIGFISTIFLLGKCLAIVVTGLQSSQSLFSQLLSSLFRAPMLFYDSTPIGRIISRVSQDLSIVDLDIPFSLIFAVGATINVYSNLAVLAVVTWQVLFVSIPMVYFALLLQRYYFASAKELMRMNGITKSYVANHVAESIAGAMTIRAFRDEHRFFEKNLQLIDMNASPNFHNFAANEWLIQRLETLSAIVLASSALCMILLPAGTMSPGFVGMALSYGLSLNTSLVFSIQNQCNLTNYLISVERLHQYMYIPSEAPEIINENRPLRDWPTMGRVEIQNLQIRYRTDSPLVLHGITCTFEAGHQIGIVGRTGSGKTTLIGALFRMVEPAAGRIIVDGIDISQIGVHDLRSRFGIIPQDPTLFSGTIRYNLDPLNQHTDLEIWEVLGKCQLRESIQEKEDGLDSLVALDGSNWSMGQRQLFCLGRAILRRSKILVLDEATASIDNYTDLIIQETIRTEFKECTVVTVAHRIPTVMDSTMVLAMSDGNIVEYEDPMVLMKRESSLFGLLVKEYWSRCNHFNSE